MRVLFTHPERPIDIILIIKPYLCTRIYSLEKTSERIEAR